MRSLGFGIERLGLLAVRAPWLVALLLVVVTVAAGSGLPRLKTDDALSELFRSSSDEFIAYTEMQKRFPVSEFDLIIIAESDKLLTPDVLEQLRLVQYDLQFSDSVDGIISIFSMRDPPNERGFPPPTVPDELPAADSFTPLAKRILDHPYIKGKFLTGSPEGPGLTIMVLALDRKELAKKGLFSVVNEVRDIAREAIGEKPVQLSFSGAPVMQLEIRESILRDRLVYNSAGFAIGMLICWVFFRRLSLVLIACLPAAVAVVWVMGALGYIGQPLNNFLNVIPPLIMVIAFSDAMHMVFSISRGLKAGLTRQEAATRAVINVGPACVLTSITTTIAMLSLTLTDSGLIRVFGFASAMATVAAFVAVIFIVPALTCLFYRNEEKFRREEEARQGIVAALDNGMGGFADWLVRTAKPVAAIGLLLLAVFSAMHLQLEPHYRLSDQVPDGKESVKASEKLDAELTGAHPLHIMVQYPEGKSLRSDAVLDVLDEVHTIHESHPKVGNVWSVITLRRWLQNIGNNDPTALGKYMDRLPKHLTGRFVNEKEKAVLITGRLPNLDAKDGVPVMRDLQEQLKTLAAKHPEFRFTVTGLSAVSALQSDSMIAQLNFGLLVAIGIVIAFIGIAFRSWQTGLFSLVSNLFPIVAAGAVLYVFDMGLEYSSVIALTVAFGLAVDDTIHVLTRLRLEEPKHATIFGAVRETIMRIGPVLILTTIVLVLGLAVTIFSELPAMRLFGLLTVLTLSSALVAGIVLLPAIVLAFANGRKTTQTDIRGAL